MQGEAILEHLTLGRGLPGNPFNSVHVEQFRVGYEKILCAAGYRPQSAHPWAEEEYVLVQEYLAQEVKAQGGLGKLLAARDAVCMSLCWALYTRTKTAINWHLHQLSTPLGR